MQQVDYLLVRGLAGQFVDVVPAIDQLAVQPANVTQFGGRRDHTL